MESWVAVGLSEDDLSPGDLRGTAAAGRDLTIARLGDGSLAAFDEWCTHEECPLSDGELEGERVVCTCHGSEFDLRTGAVLSPPATEPIAVYDVRIVGGEIEVRID
jgi:nitrite reductase/ring-hydroxylating ferredoxin subunit